MKEVLFEVFGQKVYTYSVMITIGVLFCTWIYIFRLKKLNLAENIIDRLIIITIISGLFVYLGAKFFDSLWHALGRAMVDGKIIWSNVNVDMTKDGITFSGGIITGIVGFLLIYPIAMRHDKRHVLTILDQVIPGIIIAHAFGRLGCWYGGCCWGAETTSFLGVYYPPAHAVVHPTQLYEAAFLFILFFVMIFFIKKYHSEIYLFTYGIWRFFIEFLRDDNRGASPFNALTPSQFLSIVMFIMAICFIFLRYFAYKKDIEEYASLEESELPIRYYFRNHSKLFKGLFKKCNCPNCAKQMKLKWHSKFIKTNEIEILHEEQLVFNCKECNQIEEIK